MPPAGVPGVSSGIPSGVSSSGAADKSLALMRQLGLLPGHPGVPHGAQFSNMPGAAPDPMNPVGSVTSC